MNAPAMCSSHFDHGDPVASRMPTVREAAAWAGVTRNVISGWIHSGQLPATLVERRRHVRLGDMAAVEATKHFSGAVRAWREGQ